MIALRKKLKFKIFWMILIIYLLFCSFIIGVLILTNIATFSAIEFGSYNDVDYGFEKVGDYYVSKNVDSIKQEFLVDKPDGTFRVFVLGGSAAMGTPYVHQYNSNLDELFGFLKMPNEGGVSTWVEDYLSKLYPGKDIEVINSAAGNRNISDAYQTFEEIVKVGNPDLVIFMAGNNERLTSETYGDIATYDYDFLEELVKIHSENFLEQVNNIVYLAEKSEINTYILTVPNNIRDWLPKDLPDFDVDYVKRLIVEDNFNECISYLEGETKNALRLFYLGKCYDKNEEFDIAKKYYFQARDYNKAFLQVRGEWNDIIRSVPDSEFVSVIDIEKYAMDSSPDGLSGGNLFWDNVHMNLDGNQLVALRISEEIVGDFGDSSERLNNVELKEINKETLKRLYLLKKFKTWRFNFVSLVMGDGENAKKTIDSYEEAIYYVDGAIETMADS